MNPTQVGNIIKSGLLAIGVSSSLLGYISSEMWIAIGGATLAVGAGIWQFIALKTKNLIEATAAAPEVAQVVVRDPVLAATSVSGKVKALP